ncbi:MFS transporter [Homoserinibacter sp. GY 40078]|nr:MFS transporter [Homoserinibacter sp. GY 40078]
MSADPTRDPVATAEPPTAPIRYFVGLFLAQFGLFAALLSPVMVSLQLKAQELSPDDPAAVIGAVLPLGALGALVANPLAGALSDRTRTRWGRRRPWLLGGVAVFTLGLVWVALAQDQLALTFAWLLCQVAANATLAALVASFADEVPALQRGRGASVIAVAQNVAILAGTYLAVLLVDDLPVLFIAPGVLAIALVAVYAIVLRDEAPGHAPEPMRIGLLLRSFWTNPLVHRDYGLAWWSRFLIILGSYMFTTFRLLYMQQHLGLELAAATEAVAFGVLLYTLALLASSSVSGWLSDRVRRRKVFVGGSTALFGVGLVMLGFANDVGHFYAAEVVLGFAWGMYIAVDQALIVDVLPDPERPGKDLGVLNIANALPQSIAAPLALVFLGLGVDDNTNYLAMLLAAGGVALLGAIVIIPIKGVR